MEKQLIKLSNRSVLSVNGADAEKFLQGIITCNVEKISNNSSSYGAILTPQGKLLYDFIIYRKNKDFFIDTSKLVANDLVKLLSIYKLRSEVSINEQNNLSVFVSINNKIKNISNIDPRLEELGTREILSSDNELCTTDQSLYEKEKINLGIAEVGSEINPGEVFPMEANLDHLKGIDFKKGCFIGQEVSSRMYRKGNAKKRIITFESMDTFTNDEDLVYNDRIIGRMIKKIDDCGIALIKIETITNPEIKTLSITSKNEKKNMVVNLPVFFPQ